jgi:hypothetical protein
MGSTGQPVRLGALQRPLLHLYRTCWSSSMPISRASGDRSRTASAAASCARCSDDRGMTLSLACLPDPRGGQPRTRRGQPRTRPAARAPKAATAARPRSTRPTVVPTAPRSATAVAPIPTATAPCCPDAGGCQQHADTDTGHAADHGGDLQRGRVRPLLGLSGQLQHEHGDRPQRHHHPGAGHHPVEHRHRRRPTRYGEQRLAADPDRDQHEAGADPRVPRPVPPVPLHPRADEPAERPEVSGRPASVGLTRAS